MIKYLRTTRILLGISVLFLGTSEAAIVLDFEGLKDLEYILEFYNGGTGSSGSDTGADYGISFGSNALAIIDYDDGGSGNFGGEPSPPTVMFFLNGTSILNMSTGFDTGFSFSYTAINQPASVVVYDSPNAAGNVLTTVHLPATPSDGGDPTGRFSPFYNVGIPITETAYSIDFGGAVNQVAFDDITFGSATPGIDADVPFLIGDAATNPGYSSRVTKLHLDNEEQVTRQDYFDPDAPTYIVTHGWQNSADHIDPDWNFSQQSMPEGQRNVMDSILSRLSQEQTDENGDPIKANIILFEWEGAYTGGWGNDGETLKNASREARVNADYAGVLLGYALKDILGEGYEQDIHFVGHSYGAIVNGLATRYLDGQGLLRDVDTIQFTVLDAPTAAPNGYAPNLNEDWFQNNLSQEINYVDNYFGSDFFNIGGYGEPINGSGLDQPLAWNHGNVWSIFYPDLIQNGPAADTDPTGYDGPPPWLDESFYQHQFTDWITPTLETYDSRPGNDFSTASDAQWISSISSNYENAVGTPIIATELPGYDEYAFYGLLLQEQSPVSVYQMLNIPLGAEWLVFDWMVGAGGDGDWFTVHFGNDLLFTMLINELFEGVLFDAVIDISKYAGIKDSLYYTLNSVGEPNAEFYFGNLEFRGSRAAVPEPGIFTLLLVGIVGACLIARQRSSY